MTAAFRLFGCTIDDAARGFRDLCGRDIEVFYLHVAASVARGNSKTYANRLASAKAVFCVGHGGGTCHSVCRSLTTSGGNNPCGCEATAAP
jgi:hypothetical protein